MKKLFQILKEIAMLLAAVSDHCDECGGDLNHYYDLKAMTDREIKR